jgi:hypothetical protein
MAENAGLVSIYRKLFVVKHGFAEQLDLLNPIVRWSSKPIDSLCLDMIDLALDHRNFFENLRVSRAAVGSTSIASALLPARKKEQVTAPANSTPAPSDLSIRTSILWLGWVTSKSNLSLAPRNFVPPCVHLATTRGKAI